MSDSEYLCPHCNAKMNHWKAPEDSDWAGAVKYVCFNDECPYYVRGWAWMEEKYGNKSSYRHSINPKSGQEAPLAVAYPDHMKEGIID